MDGYGGTSMVDRAIRARDIASAGLGIAETDSDLVRWVYDKETDLWLSFSGHYSHSSPTQKREAEIAREVEVSERVADIAYWSEIRAKVLDRDAHKCQLCGAKGTTKLHVHHIMKRDAGGTDHLDNLITTCPKCHYAADRKLYDPPWVTRAQRVGGSHEGYIRE